MLYAGFAVGVLLFPMSAVSKASTLSASAVVFVLSRNYIFPVLGILSCLYLIYYLPPTSWLRFAAWLNFGFVIYVGYGVVPSHLTGRQHSNRPAEHDAHTAYIGAGLALIGAALLFFMRGFDVWLAALKKHESLAGMAKASAALTDALRAEPWLEPSWFLIVPLALNAFLLCPIIIRRALRARREGGDSRQAGMTTTSLIVGVTMAAATIIYFALIAAHPHGVH